MEQRRCVHCRSRFTPLRNVHQCYCSKPTCQKMRRCNYQKRKLKHDADYKETHQSSQKKWRNNHPDYWRHYRQQHPIYVEDNRKRQVNRDQKRRSSGEGNISFSVLANMYSLNQKNIEFSSSYKTILGNVSMLANMYVIGTPVPTCYPHQYEYIYQTQQRP